MQRKQLRKSSNCFALKGASAALQQFVMALAAHRPSGTPAPAAAAP